VLSRHYGPGGGHPYALTAAADVEQEALFRTQALEWIASHPVAMAKKMGQNFLDFWYLVEGVRRSQVTAAAMTLELLLALAGGWLAWRRRRWRLAYVCAIVILYFAVVYAPIKSVFHYSLVIVPFLCVLQAFVLAWLLTRMPRRTRTSPPRPS
jgi:hypothetical protein